MRSKDMTIFVKGTKISLIEYKGKKYKLANGKCICTGCAFENNNDCPRIGGVCICTFGVTNNIWKGVEK